MRIFYGCFFASLMFSIIELVHLYQITTHNLSPQSRWLSGLYIISPILALGIGLGIVFEVILIILNWGKVGIPKEGIEQWSSWSALPIAATVLSLGLGFTISFYGTSEVVNRSFGAYFWLVPSLAFTAYLWHISRTLLAIIDRRYQKPVSFIVSIFIVLLTFVSIYFSLNEDLQSKIMTWPTFALLLIPIFFLIGFVISIFSNHLTIDRNIKRVGIILGLFGCVGVFDLSEQMNHQPIVKITILDHSLISHSIINALQPLYDRDGDGISGKMGG